MERGRTEGSIGPAIDAYEVTGDFLACLPDSFARPSHCVGLASLQVAIGLMLAHDQSDESNSSRSSDCRFF